MTLKGKKKVLSTALGPQTLMEATTLGGLWPSAEPTVKYSEGSESFSPLHGLSVDGWRNKQES